MIANDAGTNDDFVKPKTGVKVDIVWVERADALLTAADVSR